MELLLIEQIYGTHKLKELDIVRIGKHQLIGYIDQKSYDNQFRGI